jgi:hypothetical protein
MTRYSPSGDPETRGHMDSYYHRLKNPHYNVHGINEYGQPCIETVTNLTEQEIADYHRGYDWNEEFGDKKDWG